MKIQVGKTYRNRRGSDVTITEYRGPNTDWKFSDASGEWYREDGTYGFFKDEPHAFDLVFEIPEPLLQLEVGKTYVTGEGVVVTMLETTASGKFHGSDGYYYDPDGCWCGQPIGYPMSIVSEVEAPDTLPDLEISVGDVWVTRGGMRVKIIATDLPTDQPVAGYPLDYDYGDDESRVWTCYRNGRGFADREDGWDLVSKEEQPAAWLVRNPGFDTDITSVSFGFVQEVARAHDGSTVHPLYERP